VFPGPRRLLSPYQKLIQILADEESSYSQMIDVKMLFIRDYAIQLLDY